MNKNIPRPAVLLASLRIPTALFTISDFIKQYDIMTLRNLCNSLLHKFPLRISSRKFRHILQISDRKSLVRRIVGTNIC